MYYVLSIVLVFQEQYVVLLQSLFFLLYWWDVEVPTFCVAGILVSSTIKKQEVVKRKFAEILFLVCLIYTVLCAFILFQVFCLSV